MKLLLTLLPLVYLSEFTVYFDEDCVAERLEIVVYDHMKEETFTAKTNKDLKKWLLWIQENQHKDVPAKQHFVAPRKCTL